VPSAEVRAQWPAVPWGVDFGHEVCLASLLPIRKAASKTVKGDLHPALAVALIACLVDTQNRFLHRLWDEVPALKTSGEAVALTLVSEADLVAPRSDLLGPLLAANFGALKPGEYYLEGLEQQAIERFLRGRRLLRELDIRCIFREDCAQRQQLETLRRAVPQKPLAPAPVLIMLRDTEVATILRALEVALGVLVSAPAIPGDSGLLHLMKQLRVSVPDGALAILDNREVQHLEGLWRELSFEAALRAGGGGTRAFDFGEDWEQTLDTPRAEDVISMVQPRGVLPLRPVLEALWGLLSDVSRGLDAQPAWPLVETLAERLEGTDLTKLDGLTMAHAWAVFVIWARCHLTARLGQPLS
jgi:hypothetical protein